MERMSRLLPTGLALLALGVALLALLQGGAVQGPALVPGLPSREGHTDSPTQEHPATQIRGTREPTSDRTAVLGADSSLLRAIERIEQRISALEALAQARGTDREGTRLAPTALSLPVGPGQGPFLTTPEAIARELRRASEARSADRPVTEAAARLRIELCVNRESMPHIVGGWLSLDPKDRRVGDDVLLETVARVLPGELIDELVASCARSGDVEKVRRAVNIIYRATLDLDTPARKAHESNFRTALRAFEGTSDLVTKSLLEDIRKRVDTR